MAANFCVADAAALSAALWAARTNGEADHVRLRQGVYMTGQLGFGYDVVAVAGGDDHDIEISGGWRALFQLPCAFQSGNVGSTVIWGSGFSGLLAIVPGPTSNVTVRDLTFHDGNRTQTNAEGGGLHVRGWDDYSGTVRIERNVFSSNQAWSGGGLSVSVGGVAKVQLIGNLFLDNSAVSDAAAGAIFGNAATVVLANNTLLGNTGFQQDTIDVGGLRLVAAEVLVVNNLMWDQTGVDLHVTPGAELQLLNNMLSQRSGGDPDLESGSIAGPPVFSSGHYLTPALSSALVDAGMRPRAGAGWSLPTLDIRGNVRINGASVDVGAIENTERLFSDGFETVERAVDREVVVDQRWRKLRWLHSIEASAAHRMHHDVSVTALRHEVAVGHDGNDLRNVPVRVREARRRWRDGWECGQ